LHGIVGTVNVRTVFGAAKGVVTEAFVQVLRHVQVDAVCELAELDAALLLLEAIEDELELAATDDELLDFTLDAALEATLEDATEEALDEELATAGL
jgi:hypothetical protein